MSEPSVMTSDDDLFEVLTDLKAERARLWGLATSGRLDDEGRARLGGLDRDVDQCWQRLRQRRARRRLHPTTDVARRLGARCSGTLVRHVDGVVVRCTMGDDCPGLEREHARRLRCVDAGEHCPRCDDERERERPEDDHLGGGVHEVGQ